jgi:hypothetical protein
LTSFGCRPKCATRNTRIPMQDLSFASFGAAPDGAPGAPMSTRRPAPRGCRDLIVGLPRCKSNLRPKPFG